MRFGGSRGEGKLFRWDASSGRFGGFVSKHLHAFRPEASVDLPLTPPGPVDGTGSRPELGRLQYRYGRMFTGPCQYSIVYSHWSKHVTSLVVQMHHPLLSGMCVRVVGILLFSIRLSGDLAFCFKYVCCLPNKHPVD